MVDYSNNWRNNHTNIRRIILNRNGIRINGVDLNVYNGTIENAKDIYEILLILIMFTLTLTIILYYINKINNYKLNEDD